MLTNGYPRNIELTDGRVIQLRPLQHGDYERLCRFFDSLPAEERVYLAHDVSDHHLIKDWTDHVDFDRVVPIVALDGDDIVGDGTLHMNARGWMQHVGQIRLVTARTHRHKLLGTQIARELVSIAAQRDLRKIITHVIEDNVGAIRMFEAVGFNKVGIVEKLVTDRHGKDRNLVIMINDVKTLTQTMEAWIQDMTIPAFRGSSEGVY